MKHARDPAIAPWPSAVGGTVEQEHSGGRDVAPIGAGVQVPRALPVGLHGQVATYLVTWVAVLMMLAAMTMNIGQVATVRTGTANAADSSALFLASNLGGIARNLCLSLNPPDALNPEGGGGNCPPQQGDETLALLEFTLDFFTGNVRAQYESTLGLDQQMQELNDTIKEADLSKRIELREQTMARALLSVVDDASVEPDTKDIDRDGDTMESISVLSRKFRDRLRQIETSATHTALQNDVKQMKTILDAFRRDSENFRSWLGGTFIPLLNEMATQPGGALIPPMPAEVDWMNSDLPGTPKKFEEWITWLMGLKKPVKRLNKWQPQLEGYWKNWLMTWQSWIAGSWTMPGWIQELQAKKITMPAYASRIQAAIDKLTWFSGRIQDVLNTIGSFIGRFNQDDGAWTTTYSWTDHRGSHHVRVHVDKFQVPQYDYSTILAGPPIFGPGGPKVVKVSVKYKTSAFDGQRPPFVKIWRYDQDAQPRIWNWRIRRNPGQQPPPNPAVACNAKLVGITSDAEAEYGWKRDAVSLKYIDSRLGPGCPDAGEMNL